MIRAESPTALVHLAGFGTGAALYAMLGVMAVRTTPTSGARADRLPVATALLGVAWNGRGAEFSFRSRRGEGATVELTLPVDVTPAAPPLRIAS